MSYKGIISDWNGTIFEYSTDEALNRKIGYAVLDDAKHAISRGKLWRARDVYKLLKARKELKKRLVEYENGERPLREVYEPFSDVVLKGRPVELIKGVVDEYARETARKVDRRVIGPIKAAHDDGKYTGIISFSFRHVIVKTLEAARCLYVFDGIVSHELQKDGERVLGLTLDIFDKKAEAFEYVFFRKRGLRGRNTIYLGDGEDDVPIAELLAPGNFIVPFLASEEFKERMASDHKAFVPEREDDLLMYLESR